MFCQPRFCSVRLTTARPRNFYTLSVPHAARLLSKIGVDTALQPESPEAKDADDLRLKFTVSSAGKKHDKLSKFGPSCKFSINRKHKCPQLQITNSRGQTQTLPIRYSERHLAENVINTLVKSMQFTIGNVQILQLKFSVDALWRAFKRYEAEEIEFRVYRFHENIRFGIERMLVDSEAVKRQPDWAELPRVDAKTKHEAQADADGLIYVDLDPEGDIGTIVNGAGLSMATNDIIHHFGGRSANFLDTGGQATTDLLVRAFALIISKPKVKAILVNIFGGVIRCDMIAESIIRAAKELDMQDIPIVVRLRGTNQEEGQRMIRDSGLALHAMDQIDKAAQKVIELARTSPVRRFASSNVQGRRSFSSIRSLHESDHLRRQRLYRFDANESTKVVYQGFTGSVATSNARETIAYGTTIIGGTSPTKGGTTHLDRPVYACLRNMLNDGITPDITAIFVPALFAKQAILEAIDAHIPLIVSVAEGVPVHDMLEIHEALATQESRLNKKTQEATKADSKEEESERLTTNSCDARFIPSRVIGPNCPGLIHPASRVRVGIMPPHQFSPGVISIISKSGTLSYEAVAETTSHGLGQDLVVGVGGDALPGTDMVDLLASTLARDTTRGVILVGEIGGVMELDAADWIATYRDTHNASETLDPSTASSPPDARTTSTASPHSSARLSPSQIRAREMDLATDECARTPRERIHLGPAKPIVGLIAGFQTPTDKVMGHAGAIRRTSGLMTDRDPLQQHHHPAHAGGRERGEGSGIGSGSGAATSGPNDATTAKEKSLALERAGVVVCRHTGELGRAMRDLLYPPPPLPP